MATPETEDGRLTEGGSSQPVTVMNDNTTPVPVTVISGGGGAATIADGADVNSGSTTDAAIVTDANGTLSGKVRGLVKWAFERMPAALGQALMAASFPVVFPSNATGASAMQVQGGAADGAPAAGNPVQVGGVDGSGNAQALSVTTAGELKSAIGSVTTPTDATPNTAFSFARNDAGFIGPLQSFLELFNNTTWDRQRNNTSVSLLASASRTTTQTSADQTNYNARGLHVVLDVTVAGTGSITLKVEAKDAIGIYYTVLEGLPIIATGTNVYKLYPGITASANASASDILPRTFRVTITANNANAMTYSLAYSLVL